MFNDPFSMVVAIVAVVAVATIVRDRISRDRQGQANAITTFAAMAEMEHMREEMARLEDRIDALERRIGEGTAQ